MYSCNNIFLKYILLFLTFFVFGQALIISKAHAGRIEAGTFTAHDTLAVGTRDPERVNFQQNFDVPPIVVAISDLRGGNSASIRISNVTTTGFDELILEPDNFDGRHLSQTVHYIAVEPGRHVLPDGTVLEAGFTNTSAVQFGSGVAGTASFTNVSFSRPMASTPSVISQLQTFNSETRDVAEQSSRPHITALAISPTISGFQLALERSQANSGPAPSTETVGWIAIPDTSGANVTWSSVNTSANIRGISDGCFVQNFGQNSSARISVAKKITRNNPDGGWLRYCSLSATTIGVRINEDTDQDAERNVSVTEAEAASIITFSRAFHSELTADINVTKVSDNFVDTVGTGGFSLPDATFDYSINVSNDGNSRPNFDTVVALDALPSEVALVITDISGAGSGPVEFLDGAVSSELSYNFISLGSNTDSIEFSTDGSDFTHTPVDSGDGTDPDVTHIRVTLSGAMAPNSSGTASSFDLRFRAKIK